MEITKEQENKILKFHDWLRGRRNVMDDKISSCSPKLSDTKAFRIIYGMQEFLNLIPDTFEICGRCGKLFDTSKEGTFADESDVSGAGFEKRDIGKHYCETCIDRVIYHGDRKLTKDEGFDSFQEYMEVKS